MNHHLSNSGSRNIFASKIIAYNHWKINTNNIKVILYRYFSCYATRYTLHTKLVCTNSSLHTLKRCYKHFVILCFYIVITIQYSFICKYILFDFQSFKACDSFCWLSLLEYIDYTPWRWPFKGWKMLQWLIVLMQWWFSTEMRRLTTGIRSEKCVVRRFRRCANVYLHKSRYT